MMFSVAVNLKKWTFHVLIVECSFSNLKCVFYGDKCFSQLKFNCVTRNTHSGKVIDSQFGRI